MNEPLDAGFERDRVTQGDFKLVDFGAMRRHLESLSSLPDQPWQTGYHPLEDRRPA